MKKTGTTILLPNRATGTEDQLALDAGLLAEVRTGAHGRISVSLQSLGVRLLARERPDGSIELRAPWIPELMGQRSDRIATGSTHWPDAIESARQAIDLEHERRVLVRNRLREPGTPLTLRQAIDEIRSRGLVPGGTRTARERKTRAQYERAMDWAAAILYEDPTLPLTQEHVDRIVAVRTGAAGPEGAPPFQWPDEVAGRKHPKPVSPRTAEKGLQDLRTLLRRLVGVRDEANHVLLASDPMAGLAIEHHPARVLPTAGPKRHRLVLASVGEAEERLASEGLRLTETRTRPDGSRWTNRTRKRLRLIPGQLECMLVHQVLHPTRPNSWLHLRVDDVALTRGELVALRQTLDIRGRGWMPPEDIADHWPHGAIAYRKAWSKLDAERLIPLTEAFHARLSRYLDQRARVLEEAGQESPWLYPSPRDPRQPLSDTDARLALRTAEEVAREKLQENRIDPDEFVPRLKDAAWYAYRRRWAATRKELGWGHDSHADYVGDWSVQHGRTRERVYAGLSPRMILAVVSGKTFREATDEDLQIAAIKAAAGVEPLYPAALAREEEGR